MHDTVTGQNTDLGMAIPGHTAISSLLLAPNGWIYGTTAPYYSEARLFRFHPDNPTAVADLGVPVATSTEVGSLVLGADGKLYGGALDMPVIFAHDLTLGAFSQWNVSSAGISRIYSLAGPLGNKLYGGGYAGYGAGRLFSFDLALSAAQNLGTPVPGETSINALAVSPDGKVYGGTSLVSGYLFSYNPAGGVFQIYGAPVWRDTEVTGLLLAGDGLMYGSTGWRTGSLFRFDPLNMDYASSGSASSVSITPPLQIAATVPNTPEVLAMRVATDGRVYISGYSWPGPAQLSRWDPRTSTMESLGSVVYGPAEVRDLIEGPDHRIYGGGGSYSGVPSFFHYDPVTNVFTNVPLELWGEHYVHTLTRCPNGKIYGATGGSGSDHGKVFVYDPQTGDVGEFGLAVPGESGVLALVCTPSGQLYGGTTPTAHLFRVDPEKTLAADLGQPVPGEDDISALAWGRDGKLYGGTGGRGTLFVYDPATGSAAEIGEPFPPDAAVYDLAASIDGLLYGVTGSTEGHVFSYDPESGILLDRGQVTLNDHYVYSLAISHSGKVIYMGSGYSSGELVIYRPAYGFAWLSLDYEAFEGGAVDVAVDVLDLEGNVLLADASPGASLVGLPPTPAIQLRATLTTGDPDQSPALTEWSVIWTEDPKLAVQPESLAFVAAHGGPDPEPQSLSVVNESGGALSWTVSGTPDWLEVQPGSGTAPTELTVSATSQGLAAGDYQAVLHFDGPACINCPVDLPVSLSVFDAPFLELSPAAFDLTVVEGDPTPQTVMLTVDNVGIGVVTWTATISDSWLAMAPAGGTVPPSMTVVITADPAGLAIGTYSAVITVAGPPDCANCPQALPVRLEVVSNKHHFYLPVVFK